MKRSQLLVVKDANDKAVDEKEIKRRKLEEDRKKLTFEREHFYKNMNENVVVCMKDNLKVISQDNQVEDTFGRPYLSKLNARAFVGSSLYSHISVFFPRELWILLNNIINESMNTKVTTTLLKSTKKYFEKELSLEDTPSFFALWFEIDFNSSAKNSTLKEVFDDLKSERDMPFGYNRFKALRGAFLPDQKDLLEGINIFRETWAKAVSPGSIVCCDEAVWDFRPSKAMKERSELARDPIPVVFIPRKPHPNGLLCYYLAVKMFNTNLPYVIDLEPHVSFPQVGAQAALKNMIERWNYPYQAHVVADSAFGSLSVAAAITAWGGACTLAISENVVAHIWEVLNRKSSKNKWKALQNESYLYSLLAREDEDEKGKLKRSKVCILSFILSFFHVFFLPVRF
jgi:hypothetical protein